MAFLDRFRSTLAQVLRVQDTPHRIALSFAVGLFIGMSFLLGFHTVLALVVAWALKLNRVVILSGVFITNPWSIIPIYTFCTWIGTIIMGTDHVIPEINWDHLTVVGLFSELSHLVLPFVVGTTAVGFLAAAASYVIIRNAAESAQADEA